MSKHITKKEDRVPFFEKLMYGIGSGSFQLANDGVKGLAYPIFNLTLGLNPSLIGLVLMISRIVDAFTDPLMGSISDNTRSRFGRRRPYILIGSILVSIAFCVIWLVPESWSSQKIFIWYLISMLVFYLCTTIQNVPYHTLGLEMTADHHERTVISSYKMFFSFVFTMFVGWIYAITQSEKLFNGVMHGIRTISLFIAPAIVLGGALSAIFVKERYYHIASKASKVPFWEGAKKTFQNKSFRLLTGIILTTGIAGTMVAGLGPYIIFYHIFDGDLKTGAVLAALGANVFQICAIASLPLLTALCSRIGKVRTLQLVCGIGIIGALSNFVLYNKQLPYLVLAAQGLAAPLASGFWMLTTSMKADICDDDELRHGARREGMFGAVGNWIFKMTMACTFFLAGVILESTGFDVALKGNQAPETLMRMRVLFSVVPAISGTIALILLKLYPLNEKRLEEIRVELENRRQAVGSNT